MNRVTFMTELAALLQDIPAEERRDAMQYYNDYFDDAGPENEQEVILELESPEKVAEKIRADVPVFGRSRGYAGGRNMDEDSGQPEPGKGGERSERPGDFTEQQNHCEPDGQAQQNHCEPDGQAQQYYYEPGGQPPQETEQSKPWSSNLLKVILVIAILVVGVPIVLPVMLAVLAIAFACVVAVFAIFIALVAAAAALVVTGVVLLAKGVFCMFAEPAVSLALVGSGLIIGVLGTIGTVAGVKLCLIVFPALIRGAVEICRKPFHRKAVTHV